MKNIKDVVLIPENRKEKILQFGEGNFIRAFVDWMIDAANKQGVYDGSVAICQPIPQGLADVINGQNGAYTVVIRDMEEGQMKEEVIVNTCISRCINPYTDYDKLLEVALSPDLEVIISNTTEKGIEYRSGDRLEDKPQVSFPGKLTALLYKRFMAGGKGLLIIPLELINDNGSLLKNIVLEYAEQWGLGEGFVEWFARENHIVSTLVDRIVTGYPRDEAEEFEKRFNYQDNLIDTCEKYNLLAIEGKEELAEILPIHKTRANVIWTDDITEYRERKLYILNGAHNAIGLAGFYRGHKYVIDLMRDDVFRAFTEKVVFEEIVSNFKDREQAEGFAREVLGRFSNPFIKHNLMQIAIHGCSKFMLRCLPSIRLFYERTGSIPKLLSFSFAAFILFYKGELEDGLYYGTKEDGSRYEIKDSAEVIQFFARVWENNDISKAVHETLANTGFWNGEDLTEMDGLEELIIKNIQSIVETGMDNTMKNLMKETTVRN